MGSYNDHQNQVLEHFPHHEGSLLCYTFIVHTGIYFESKKGRIMGISWDFTEKIGIYGHDFSIYKYDHQCSKNNRERERMDELWVSHIMCKNSVFRRTFFFSFCDRLLGDFQGNFKYVKFLSNILPLESKPHLGCNSILWKSGWFI